jgi:hypothetical protein
MLKKLRAWWRAHWAYREFRAKIIKPLTADDVIRHRLEEIRNAHQKSKR